MSAFSAQVFLRYPRHITTVPAGTQIKKSLEGATADQRAESTAKAGRHQYDVGGNSLKDIQAILFGKYASPEAKAYFDKKPKEAVSNPFLK